MTKHKCDVRQQFEDQVKITPDTPHQRELDKHWRKGHLKACRVCQEEKTEKYNEKYDSYYNPETMEWLEKACGDDHCPYCRQRPEKAPKEN